MGGGTTIDRRMNAAATDLHETSPFRESPIR
jgi:hypothetical protein